MNEMDTLADLGAALSPTEVPMDRLRARADAVTAAAATAQARADGGRRRVTPRRWPRPALAAASVTALAAGAALLAVLTGTPEAGQTGRADQVPAPVVRPAGFTVARNADGSVTFTVKELRNLEGATKALNDAGIAGRVLTSTPGCTSGPAHNGQIDVGDLSPPDTVLKKYRTLDKPDTVTVRSSDYPIGGGLLLVAGELRIKRQPTSRLMLVAYAYADATRIPTCVNFADPGTGG